MPFSLKRPMKDKPQIKEWYSHDPDNDGYEEIVKYKTRERAQEVAKQWGGSVEIVEVIWGAGEDPESFPDY